MAGKERQAELPAEPIERGGGPLGRAAWLALLAAFLGWLFDGFEMGLFPLVARPALRSLLASSGAGDEVVSEWIGIITAAFLLGAASGGIVFGWLGDRVGRVRAMSLSILTYSLFTGLTYFANEPWQLGALRFVAALGMGGEWSLGVALVMEVWGERHRPLLAGAIGAAANLGFLLVGSVGKWLPITIDSWRWIMLVGALPALLVFLIRLGVKESERWREASRSAPTRPLAEVFGAALRGRTFVAIGLASVVLIGTWAAVTWIPSWVDRLSGGKDPGAKATAVQAYGIGATLGSFLGPLLTFLGRRAQYALFCVLSTIACAIQFRFLHEWNSMFVVMIGVTGATTAAFYGFLPLYLPELFPTRARATGQGVAFNFGRVFAAGFALLGGQIAKAFDGDLARAGGMVTLVYLLGLVLVLFAPETRGERLPS